MEYSYPPFFFQGVKMERLCDSCQQPVESCPALVLSSAKQDETFDEMPREDICNLMRKEKDAGFALIDLLVVVIIVLIAGSVVVGSCSQLFFNAEYSGTVIDNQQLGSGQTGFFASQDAKEIAFSRALNIRTQDGQDIVFSTIDRQFFVVKPGDCIKVKVFIYPPWMISKAGSMYNGRLLRKWQCSKLEQ